MNHPFSHEPIVPLSCLLEGEDGEIHSVLGEQSHVRRLAEMGVRSGVPIRVLTAGTPCIADVAGQRLCLRGCESLEVLVRRVSAA